MDNAAPAPAAADKTAALAAAAERGEPLRIKYHGGSQPGAPRQIMPHAVEGDKLRAVCLASKIEKSYIIDKIEIINGNGETLFAAATPYAPPPVFIVEVYNQYKTEWEESGWHVELDGNNLALYKKYKNGNPQKYPKYWFIYREEKYDYTDFSTGETIYKKNERPWDANGHCYKHADKAIAHFIETMPRPTTPQ